MDRVAVAGHGFAAGGQPFHPVGTNLIQLGPDSAGVLFHNMFDPGCYDAARMDGELHDIGSADPEYGWAFNVVRVFVCTNLYCTGFGMSAPGIDPCWLANLRDFIQRAAAQGVRVYLTGMTTAPGNYAQLAGSPTAGLEPNDNWPLLDPNYAVTASERFWRDLLAGIGPALWPSIFAIDLANEVAVRTDQAPFNLTSGQFAFWGQNYDMGSGPSRDALVLNACTIWANGLASAVRQAAPGVLVTASVYPPTAAGITYPAGVQSPTSWYPMQAGWLESHSTLDFVDAHTYYDPRTPVVQALASSGLPTARTKPLIIGETGVQRSQAQTAAGAGWLLQRLLTAANHYGATGYLPWSWDESLDDGDATQALFYDMVGGDYAIASALTPVNWSPWA